MSIKTEKIFDLTCAIRPSKGRIADSITSEGTSLEIQLGQKALDVLFEIGFEEGDDLTDVRLVDIVSVPGGGPKIAKEILRFRESKLRKVFSVHCTKEEHLTVLQYLISCSRVRTQNVIVTINPQTILEFVNLSSEAILSTKNCGKETYDEIFGFQSEIRKILDANPNTSHDQLMDAIAS